MKFAGCSIAALVMLTAGCYSYVPVQSPNAGMEVRARLKTEAAVRRSAGLDEPVTRVDGIVVESPQGTLALDVLVARSSGAFQNVTIRDTVRLESVEVESVLRRKFSTPRTALAVIGAGVAAFGIVAGLDQVVGGTDTTPGPGTPTFRSPAIVIPFGFRR